MLFGDMAVLIGLYYSGLSFYEKEVQSIIISIGNNLFGGHN
jgi:hypothetical protein